MHIISARNVNHALQEGMWHLATCGHAAESRNGSVVVAPGPVLTTYHFPMERVLFNQHRDANPFFHLMEALWMLAGRNDLAFVQRFVQRMANYSDDGVHLQGAYGHRWRRQFSLDQLHALITLLKRAPDTRRAVLQMWSAEIDLSAALQDGKDVPCNTHAYLELKAGALCMTLLCRSNDAVWGAHGANAVQFSMLLEYLAAAIGAEVGRLQQFSNNYHAYCDWYAPEELKNLYAADDRYTTAVDIAPYPLVSVPIEVWDTDLMRFMSDPMGDTKYEDQFFHAVAAPMFSSWDCYKRGEVSNSLCAAQAIAAADWRTACIEWIQRRNAPL